MDNVACSINAYCHYLSTQVRMPTGSVLVWTKSLIDTYICVWYIYILSTYCHYLSSQLQLQTGSVIVWTKVHLQCMYMHLWILWLPYIHIVAIWYIHMCLIYIYIYCHYSWVFIKMVLRCEYEQISQAWGWQELHLNATKKWRRLVKWSQLHSKQRGARAFLVCSLSALARVSGASEAAGIWLVSRRWHLQNRRAWWAGRSRTVGLEKPAAGLQEPATNCRTHALSRLALLHGYKGCFVLLSRVWGRSGTRPLVALESSPELFAFTMSIAPPVPLSPIYNFVPNSQIRPVLSGVFAQKSACPVAQNGTQERKKYGKETARRDTTIRS